MYVHAGFLSKGLSFLISPLILFCYHVTSHDHIINMIAFPHNRIISIIEPFASSNHFHHFHDNVVSLIMSLPRLRLSKDRIILIIMYLPTSHKKSLSQITRFRDNVASSNDEVGHKSSSRPFPTTRNPTQNHPAYSTVTTANTFNATKGHLMYLMACNNPASWTGNCP